MPLFFSYIIVCKICFFAIRINITSKYYFCFKSKSFEGIFYCAYTTKRCGKAYSSIRVGKIPIYPTCSFYIYIVYSILYFLVISHLIFNSCPCSLYVNHLNHHANMYIVVAIFYP